MSVTTKQENTLTHREQSAITILEEIANNAHSMSEALMDMEFEGTNVSTKALPLFRVFAEKIGWMAELGVKRLSGLYTMRGDAEDWFLSPAARDAVRETEAEPRDNADAPAQNPVSPIWEILGGFMRLDDEGRQKLLDSLTAANQPAPAQAEEA